jgi:hypothetical protein
MTIHPLISGRHYDLAETIPRNLTLPDGASLDAALAAIESLLASGAKLPPSCLVAVAGNHLGTVERHTPHLLHDGDELLLLAPIAGG